LKEYEKEAALLHETERVATEVLIDASGKNCWELHRMLEYHGFRVEPGETDGCGWLSGCICTRKGILLYG